MHCLSFDLEDWFHFLDLKDNCDVSKWQRLESHVERMTDVVLRFLDRHNQKATFFVLGWVAETHRDLVKRIARRGHEVACHSYAHPLVYTMTPTAFEADLVAALDCIEGATGSRPTTYRAPGFSITSECLWAFGTLRKNGIVTDSSVFPARRAHGGIEGAPTRPFLIETAHGDICELPLSSVSVLGFRLVYSGGGYFRILPGWLLERLFLEAEAKGEPVMTYFHPRDFFADAPIPKMSRHRVFKARVGLSRNFAKLERLLKGGQFGTVCDYVELVGRNGLPYAVRGGAIIGH